MAKGKPWHPACLTVNEVPLGNNAINPLEGGRTPFSENDFLKDYQKPSFSDNQLPTFSDTDYQKPFNPTCSGCKTPISEVSFGGRLSLL